jgi:hypothetical protein
MLEFKLCKDGCGRPRNKWTSYCNECYNGRKRKRFERNTAKKYLADNTPSREIPVEFLQATVDVSSEEIATLWQALKETRTLVSRLCTHLEEYRPDLSEYYRGLLPQEQKRSDTRDTDDF